MLGAGLREVPASGGWMARLVLDGQAYDLPAGTDAAALRRRAADVMSGRAGNVGLDRITLAGGEILEVNWRVVGVVRVVENDPDGDG
jgi:hypothetical protein